MVKCRRTGKVRNKVTFLQAAFLRKNMIVGAQKQARASIILETK